jgi:predicted RNA methylase
MIDQIYTPPELASVVVGCLPRTFQPKVIADFAAGEGSLLCAGENLWPRARTLANDLSLATVRWLKASHPEWVVANADFLNDRSVRSSSLNAWTRRVDLVLLNPPFSQRSRTPLAMTYRGDPFKVSLAMAFVVKSLKFIHRDSYVLAVLPDGCLVSKCDEQIWHRLSQDFHVEVLRDNANSAFDGVRARTSIVRISRLHRALQNSALHASRSLDLAAPYELKRSQRALPLVHTSHLIQGQVVQSGPRVVAKHEVRGPAILFPRVGRVTPDKVCVLEAGQNVALSDCVIAIERLPTDQVLGFRQAILSNWATLAEAYRGTGAPHITLARASAALARVRELAIDASSPNLYCGTSSRTTRSASSRGRLVALTGTGDSPSAGGLEVANDR